MADYLSPPPSLSSSPPLSPPLFSPSFHISSFLSLQNRHNFSFVALRGMGVSAECKSFEREEVKKSLPCPCLCYPTNTKKITAVLLATSYLSREPVQRLLDLAKNMCIYCIAVSVQHAYADLKIMLKICFLLWFPNSFFFPFGGGGNFCFFLTLKRPNHFIGWGRRVSLLCRPCNFLVIASLLHQQGE